MTMTKLWDADLGCHVVTRVGDAQVSSRVDEYCTRHGCPPESINLSESDAWEIGSAMMSQSLTDDITRIAVNHSRANFPQVDGWRVASRTRDHLAKWIARHPGTSLSWMETPSRVYGTTVRVADKFARRMPASGGGTMPATDAPTERAAGSGKWMMEVETPFGIAVEDLPDAGDVHPFMHLDPGVPERDADELRTPDIVEIGDAILPARVAATFEAVMDCVRAKSCPDHDDGCPKTCRNYGWVIPWREVEGIVSDGTHRTTKLRRVRDEALPAINAWRARDGVLPGRERDATTRIARPPERHKCSDSCWAPDGHRDERFSSQYRERKNERKWQGNPMPARASRVGQIARHPNAGFLPGCKTHPPIPGCPPGCKTRTARRSWSRVASTVGTRDAYLVARGVMVAMGAGKVPEPRRVASSTRAPGAGEYLPATTRETRTTWVTGELPATTYRDDWFPSRRAPMPMPR